MKLVAPSLAALAVTILLVALSLVTWRQSRALEGLAELDRVERALSLTRAERSDLENRIQVLQSRSRVVPEARERLGMRPPNADEIILLERRAVP